MSKENNFIGDLPYDFCSGGFDYISNSSHKKENIKDYKLSFIDDNTGFDYQQRMKLLNFFFVNPLSNKEYRTLILKKYQWIKTNGDIDTNKITKELLESSLLYKNIKFCSIINNEDLQKLDFITFEKNKLDNAQCGIDGSPRAILVRDIPKFTVKFDDNSNKINVYSNGKPEPRIQCLFRHLRNSIAHNYTYFINENVLFIDFDSRNTISAVILIKKQTLLDWITLVENGPQETNTSF